MFGIIPPRVAIVGWSSTCISDNHGLFLLMISASTQVRDRHQFSLLQFFEPCWGPFAISSSSLRTCTHFTLTDSKSMRHTYIYILIDRILIIYTHTTYLYISLYISIDLYISLYVSIYLDLSLYLRIIHTLWLWLTSPWYRWPQSK